MRWARPVWVVIIGVLVAAATFSALWTARRRPYAPCTPRPETIPPSACAMALLGPCPIDALDLFASIAAGTVVALWIARAPGRSLSATLFAVFGAVLLLGAIALAVLGSFGHLAAASVGMFLVAAALTARAAGSPGSRTVAMLSLGGVAMIIFGMVTTPLVYRGSALVGAALIVAATLRSLSRKAKT